MHGTETRDPGDAGESAPPDQLSTNGLPGTEVPERTVAENDVPRREAQA